MTSQPCRQWTVVHTPAALVVLSAVSTEDVADLPETAMGVLRAQVSAYALDIVNSEEVQPTDADAADMYPKTTYTFMVCLRAIRVMFAPAELWGAHSGSVH